MLMPHLTAQRSIHEHLAKQTRHCYSGTTTHTHLPRNIAEQTHCSESGTRAPNFFEEELRGFGMPEHSGLRNQLPKEAIRTLGVLREAVCHKQHVQIPNV